MQPSQQPTSQPSTQPTSQPSAQPSNQPTEQPSQQPTSFPTSKPTKWTWSSPPNVGGCNTTALKNCLNCMVAPPGFSVATLYKQYSCIGQALSATPSALPTTAPTVASSLAPTSVVTWSPTYAVGNVPGAVGVATVAVTQSLSGLSIATARSPAFQTTFIQTVANQIGQSANHVVITSVTENSRRKLLAGVNIAYTVTVENTNPTILAQIITSNSAALSQSLTTAGYPTTVTTVSAAPATALPQPTLPPVASGTTTRQSIHPFPTSIVLPLVDPSFPLRFHDVATYCFRYFYCTIHPDCYCRLQHWYRGQFPNQLPIVKTW